MAKIETKISTIIKKVEQVVIPDLFGPIIWTKCEDGGWEDKDGDLPDQEWIMLLLEYVLDNEKSKVSSV